MNKPLVIAATASSVLLALGVGLWTGAVYHDQLGMAMHSAGTADDAKSVSSNADTHAQIKPDAPAPASTAKTLYHCGMHPWILQDRPGSCPICHMELTPIHGHADQSTSGPGITIDPAVVQNMGVQTAAVQKGTLTKALRTVGYLEVPETGLFDITLKVNGYIDKLYADKTGMHIHKGDPLFELYSPDLVTAEEELIAARKSLDALASAPDDARQLANRLQDSARRKLQLLDIANSDIDRIASGDHAQHELTFRSPAEGDLQDKMVVQGAAVQAGMKLMRIEDHHKLWLEAQVYEGQLPLVELGATADATLDAAPGRTLSGKIIFINPHLDHMTRTVNVRIELDNPDFTLKPGMYATVSIHGRQVEDAVLVPREAVIDTGTRKVVFVQEAQGHFIARNVTTGLAGDNDQLQILAGLAPGESVVTSGQFLMDVESRTQEAIQKLQGSQLAQAPESAMSATTQAAAATMASPSSAYTDTLVAAYLQLASVLQQDDTGEKSAEVADLLTASMKLGEQLPSNEQPLASGFTEAVTKMQGHPIEQQRKEFEPVGAAIVALIDKAPPSSAIAPKLYVLNCPMEHADWLQTQESVRNPFLPSMRTCGSVTRALTLSPAK